MNLNSSRMRPWQLIPATAIIVVVLAIVSGCPDGSLLALIDNGEPGDGGDGATTYAMGDEGPAGGVVFYDKGNADNGWRYLEVAPVGSEIVHKPWGGFGHEVGGTAQHTALGTGAHNTVAVSAEYGDADPFSFRDDYAARVCLGLQSGGYGDWFLPSRAELELLWETQNVMGIGPFPTGLHWTSTEIDGQFVWTRYMEDSSEDPSAKNMNEQEDTVIRAIRAFRSEHASYVVLYHPNDADGGVAPVDWRFYEPAEAIMVKHNEGGLHRAGFGLVGWRVGDRDAGPLVPPGTTITMGSSHLVLWAAWQD